MKQIIALLVVLSLLSIVFFGFLAMTGDLHDMTRCFVAALQGKDCPESAGWLSVTIFHLNALKLFSAGVISVIFLVLVAIALSPRGIRDSAAPTLRERISSLDFFSFQPARKLLSWISLTLHSPTALFGR
jgi:hypothetical protein